MTGTRKEETGSEKEDRRPRMPERPGGVGRTQKETSRKLTRIVEDLFPCRNLATVKTMKRHLDTLKKETADGVLFCNHNHQAHRHHDNTHVLKKYVRRQNIGVQTQLSDAILLP